MDQLEVAWIAGFFDGEGCVYISTPRSRSFVTIAQKDPTTLQFVQSYFGGRIYGEQGPMRNSHILRLRSEEAVTFLLAVRPHLRVKGSKADQFVELYAETLFA